MITSYSSAFLGSSTLASATSSSNPGGGLRISVFSSSSPRSERSCGETFTPIEEERVETSNIRRLDWNSARAARGSTSNAESLRFVSGSERTVGFGLSSSRLLRRSTSRASPNEWAGSVDTMSTFRSRSNEDANSTARAEEMEVFPTPPFPPTNTTGVSPPPLRSTASEISSMRGCSECSLVGDDEAEWPTTRDHVENRGGRKDGRRSCAGVRAKYFLLGGESRAGDGPKATAGDARRAIAAMIAFIMDDAFVAFAFAFALGF
mmetsp:Transcript_2840/g.6008  ORF Transcript_2840/g.6008 Transcript_2840/m.6008 type:complete len:263 (-) Transcript_2840:7-795(-)